MAKTVLPVQRTQVSALVGGTKIPHGMQCGQNKILKLCIKNPVYSRDCFRHWGRNNKMERSLNFIVYIVVCTYKYIIFCLPK